MTRLAIKDILVVTECPPWRDRILPFALSVAKAHGARVDTVHPVPTDFFERKRHMLRRRGVGQAWENIRLIAGGWQKLIDASAVEEATRELFADHTYDLVISGAGQPSTTSFGCRNTGMRMIAEATCPVLILGPHAGARYEVNPEPQRVLYATDFSTAAVLAGQYATALAQEFQSRFTMLHVVQGLWRLAEQERSQIKQPFRKWMSELVPEELPLWCDLDQRVEFGQASKTIVRVSEEIRSDLIVMGFSGLEGMTVQALGDTASEVIECAPCPVLIVREGIAPRELPQDQRETTESLTPELAA